MGAIFILARALAGVDANLLSAVCFVESGHKPSAYVAMDGRTPSYGLCQIKLGTAKHMGYRGTAKGLMDPYTNALYAAKYLRWQYRRYKNWDMAISGYNAGRAIRGNAGYVNKVKAHHKGRTYGSQKVAGL
jgi:soluble lytic murein transglycosylase-like protein